MEWIKVEDGLPKDGDRVLVRTFTENYNFALSKQQDIINTEIVDYCSFAKQYVVAEGESKRTEVKFNTWRIITHWMPLPKPPNK